MKTDQRIDRLKLQMIEMSQKLDQLLEGQAQILAVFTRPHQDTGATIEGLADMTTKVYHLADRANDLADN